MALRALAIAQAAELGGAEHALLRLAPGLREDGIEIALAVPAQGGVADAARDLGLQVHVLPFGPLRRGAWPRALAAWPRTRALVGRWRPDVVWLNGVVPLRLAPALGRTPMVVHLHDLLDRAPTPWRSRRFWRSVAVVACASDAVANAAAAVGAPGRLLRTLPVPVEPPEPAERPGWADGRPVVGFVGRIEPRKGVLDLLAAMPALAERVERVRLVIVRGPAIEPDRDYERRFEASAAALGDSVAVVGPVENAAAVMPWFDVLCVPSRVEPFGTVAAEALAAGTPAVVTSSGGMREYVTPGVNGDVVAPGDPARLAEALERALARADEMADAARDSVARFRTAEAVRATAAMLREAAGR